MALRRVSGRAAPRQTAARISAITTNASNFTELERFRGPLPAATKVKFWRRAIAPTSGTSQGEWCAYIRSQAVWIVYPERRAAIANQLTPEVVMRTFCLAVVATALALTGCATTGDRSTLSTAKYSYEIDQEQVALVDRTARTRGVQIVWVHMPRKRVAIASSD
ncbi:MAG: hypothetical protein SGI99_04555 [Pseudomonadota bacterium]|nr:hypothetical protein [Pseudomonadota bacterium]